MYVNMQIIGNELSGNQGWNADSGNTATYELSASPYTSFKNWKPEASLCPGSGGMIFSTQIRETGDATNHGSLILFFDADAVLQTAQFLTLNGADDTTSTTGNVTGATPEAIGAEIERLTPSGEKFKIGAAGNHSVQALASGVYSCCTITAIHSGKVLGVAGNSTSDGAEIMQWTDTGADNLRWRLVPVSPTSYIIVPLHSSKALAVAAGSTSDSAKVIQLEYAGAPDHHWKVIENGNNDYRIEACHSGKVLDVLNADMADGALVQQYSYGGASNQRWRIDGIRP